MRFRTRTIGIVTLGLSCVLASTAPAFGLHDGWHRYSHAWESSSQGTFTGSKVTRAVFSVPTETEDLTCSTPITGHPVYTTMWLQMSANADRWIEIGTGYQCGAYRYQYWGFGTPWTGWRLLGTISQPAFGNYTYEIVREGSNVWKFKIGGVQVGEFVWTATGSYADVGLESYDAQATVDWHSYWGLQVTRNQGAWTNWSGRDGSAYSSGMCGSWNSDTSWRAKQGAC